MKSLLPLLTVLLCTNLASVLAATAHFGHGHFHKHPTPRRAATPVNSPLPVTPFDVATSFLYGNSTIADSAFQGEGKAHLYFTGTRPGPNIDPSTQLPIDVSFMAQQAGGLATEYWPADGSVMHFSASDALDSMKLYWIAKEGAPATQFDTPGTVYSGRIYVAMDELSFSSTDGTFAQPDPNNLDSPAGRTAFAFIEFTHGKSVLDPEDMTVNLSFEDWVSLPVGMNVTYTDDNGTESSSSIGGLKPGTVDNMCDYFATLGSFWPQLCIESNGTRVHVSGPHIYGSINQDPTNEVHTYWDSYVDMVWNKYTAVNLLIDAQQDVINSSIITCRVQSSGRYKDYLYCDQGAGAFSRPTSMDIWTCNSGPFANTDGTVARSAVIPRLCAAFHRSTLHMDGIQPSAALSPQVYYNYDTTNHFAKAVHNNLMDGMGYAFSYDDVHPDINTNTAGLISTSNPVRLDIYINA
ncbi:hypothetical protein F5Y16DRAFT_165738 [Xylariaceae sp. FL0255]|nr:hypothetical protein F5Y16DRAFT_165738 [Xylariaceae sp. FL0255]